MSEPLSNKDNTFTSFLTSYVSLSVIAGLFTYRVLNSLLENIILPLIDITVLPETKFHKLTKTYDYQKKEISTDIEKSKYVYIVRPGVFLKELVIWCFMMLLLYLIYKIKN